MHKLTKQVLFYISWWLQGLGYFLPERFYSFFFTSNKNKILFQKKDSNVTAQLINVDNDVIEDLTFNIDTTEQCQSFSDWVSYIQSQRDTALIYQLSEQQVLHRSLYLPINAKNTLREILSFEMDRRTPFKVNDIYFDYCTHHSSGPKDQIQVELYVAKKHTIDSTIELMENTLKVKLDSITQSINPHSRDINFLPNERRRQRNSRPITTTLTFLLLLSFIASLCAPILKKEAYLKELQQSADRYRKEALKTQELKSQEQVLLEKTNALVSQYSSQVPAIIILDTLTKTLPDSTWVSRLVVKENTLHIHGESDSAAELISLLESTPILSNVKFSSSTTVNKATQKERFQLYMLLDRNSQQ